MERKELWASARKGRKGCAEIFGQARYYQVQHSKRSHCQVWHHGSRNDGGQEVESEARRLPAI